MAIEKKEFRDWIREGNFQLTSEQLRFRFYKRVRYKNKHANSPIKEFSIIELSASISEYNPPINMVVSFTNSEDSKIFEEKNSIWIKSKTLTRKNDALIPTLFFSITSTEKLGKALFLINRASLFDEETRKDLESVLNIKIPSDIDNILKILANQNVDLDERFSTALDEAQQTDDPEVYWQLGQYCKNTLEDLNKAILAYKEIPKDSLYYCRARLKMGIYYQTLGETKKAIDCYKEVLPNDSGIQNFSTPSNFFPPYGNIYKRTIPNEEERSEIKLYY